MRRGEPADRLRDIASAGGALLGGIGYRRTRMADVAAAAGLSAGAVYTYVDSKEALFHHVLTSFFEPCPVPPSELPLTAPELQVTLDAVRLGLRRDGAVPLLQAALAKDPPPDVRGELSAILEEMYSMVSKLWPVLAVLEKCAEDILPVQDFYFGQQRRGHLSRFARYVERRASEGYLDVSGDAALSAQVAVEAVTWHAWHRLEGFDASRFTDPDSRSTVIDFAVKALVSRP